MPMRIGPCSIKNDTDYWQYIRFPISFDCMITEPKRFAYDGDILMSVSAIVGYIIDSKMSHCAHMVRKV